ncbi:coiled-coil domain-containing protein 86 [Larimichthys crocea]|uniref:coiled-coil domain-containing protein 86 n=1 Tax=Larimichthys crocea TaxID=215358 RepID=UPI00054AFDD6|nr:coiled-coil domain-containing protein 86 [Larimichthys crocea]
MSRRQRAMPEEKPAPEAPHAEEEEEEEEVQEPPPETRRTRSGRKVRTPAALLDSEAPVRTPTRRTRRSVLQEKNTEVAERVPESVPEEKLGMSAEPEPAAEADSHPSEPAAAETGPTSTDTSTDTIPKKKPRLGASEPQKPVIPLGKPKSGRVWKNRNKQRFSAVVRDKSLCSSWEKKMAAKRDKDLVKQYSSQLKEEKAKQKEEKRKRREENLKRRAENERKSEIVQVIKNTTKIKRMKKKQLRKIEKRDTLALLQKSQKSPKQNVKAKAQKSNKVDQDLT